VGFDVYLSYAKADRARALALCEGLTTLGVAVRQSEHGSETLASIEARVAGCKALVALYSHAYATPRACQWELTAALLAARADGGDPLRRVLVVNPERGADHVQPVALRAATVASTATDADARRVAAHVERLDGSLGERAGSALAGRRAGGPPRFVGRAREMWAVHAALSAGEVALIASAGDVAGTGMSLLAREYALRFAAAYPGGVFWLRAHVHADGGEDPGGADRDTQLLACAEQLAIDTAQLVPHDVPGALARTLDERGEAFLWIVDDLPGGLSRTAVDRWLAPGGCGHTLLSTRSTDYDALAARIDVGALSSREGLELLTQHRSPRGLDEERAALRLVDDLGGHALALDVAGAALRPEHGARPDVASVDALAGCREAGSELASNLVGALPRGHEASIASVLARTVGRLEDATVDLLRLASRLARDAIEADLVTAVFALDHGLDVDAARWQAAGAIREAASWSLAEMIDDGDACAVHPLISRAACMLDPDASRADALADAATAALTHRLRASAAGRVSAVSPATLAHARHLAVARDDEPRGTLLFAVAEHDLDRGDLRSARALHEQALGVYRRVLGDEHPKTLTALDETAVMLRAQGALDAARALHELALATRRRLLGDEHPDTLATTSDLVGVLRALGELPGVRAVQEHALASRRRRLGDEHPDTLETMDELAGTLREQGDLPGARALHEQVLATRRRLLGDEHPDTPAAMSNLAETLGAQGDLVATRIQHEQALAASRRVFGDEHPDTLTSLNNLAATLLRQGDLARARPLLEHVLAARRRVLGDEHPDALASMHDLASTLLEQDELVGARALHQHALVVRRQLLGDEHPDTLESMNGLAVTLLEQGELSRGHILLTQTLHTLASMGDRAAALCRHGDLAGARALREHVLTTRRRLLGDEHPDTLESMQDLAGTLLAQGALGGARGLQEQVLSTRRRVLGDEHPQTDAAQRALEDILEQLDEDGSGAGGSPAAKLLRRWRGRFG
jgi:tetratricopeptide (TPR) repeat protein